MATGLACRLLIRPKLKGCTFPILGQNFLGFEGWKTILFYFIILTDRNYNCNLFKSSGMPYSRSDVMELSWI